MTHCGTQWIAVWLHKTMCSSFSFICNRPQNPEHSWGYQTVLLCYLLCGRFESRLGAQVSTQELCKTQCNFGCIDLERTWIYERDEAQVVLSSLMSPYLIWDCFSQLHSQEISARVRCGGSRPSCCFSRERHSHATGFQQDRAAPEHFPPPQWELHLSLTQF